MPNLNLPMRRDVNAAWRQLEVEAQQRDAAPMREARRMVYRPRSSYVRCPKFIVWFCWLGGAAAIFVWLVRLNHWLGH